MSRFKFGEIVNINVGQKQVPVTFAGSYKTRAGITWLMFEGTDREMYARTENSFVISNGKSVTLSEPEKTQ